MKKCCKCERVKKCCKCERVKKCCKCEREVNQAQSNTVGA